MKSIYLVNHQQFFFRNNEDIACAQSETDISAYSSLEGAVEYVETLVRTIEAATGVKFIIDEVSRTLDTLGIEVIRTYAQHTYAMSGVREAYRITKQRVY